MHQANFLLRQHTPMAHFQHHQTDATLRATELRPALDRYLIENIFNNDLNAFAGKGWLLALDEKKATKIAAKLLETGEAFGWSFDNHLAFDYKMRIEPLSKVEGFHKIDDSRTTGEGKFVAEYPMLLANMGGKEDRNDLKNLILHKGVAITIQTRHSALLAHVKTALPALVARNNFGNRSRKGFGSFTCIRVDDQEISMKMPFKYHFSCNVSEMDSINYPTKNGQRQHPVEEFGRQRSLFTIIDIFYKTLRSGINYGHKDFYFKSLLFRYVDIELKEQWDKKTIKERYFVSNSTKGQFDHRDYLGLSTVEQWGNRGIITKSGGEGFRFPSPVIFKPVRIDENKFEVWFDLQLTTKVLKEFQSAIISIQKDGTGSLSLQPSPNFSPKRYFNYIFNELTINDLDDHVAEFDNRGLNCADNQIYKNTIRPIFNQIYKNLQPENQ